jgi:hypothetical protein
MKKLLLFCFLLSSFFMKGQVNLTTTTYSENLNALNSTGSPTWTDNTTIVGVYSQRSGTGTTIVADAGAGNGGNLYSYGVASATERAIGSLGSGNAAAGSFAHGLRIKNNLGSSIASLSVSYVGEQWRSGGTSAGANTVNFSYQTSTGTALTALSPGTTSVPAGFTAVTSLDFTSPIINSATGALDGNLTANRVAKTATITFSSPIPNGGEILLRWGDPDHTGTDHGLAIDDISITAILPTPTLTATPTTIPAFNYVFGNGPSNAGSYTLSGSVLTPAAGDITVTAPTNFEISKISATTDFADNLLIPYTGGAFTATTIYTRLKAGLAVNSPNPPYAGNITNSGGGASNVTVAVSGTVTSVPPPIITTTGTLSTTFNTVVGTPSTSQSYTVSGVDLVSDIIITAPTDFEIKTGAGAYANMLMLTPSSGSVPTTTIDVRLKGTTEGTFPGNISHASTNVSPDINVAVNGVVGAECGTSTDIATIRASLPAVGGTTTVTVGVIASGTVTGIFGDNKFYLQDATGGIAVFTTGIRTTLGLALGDQVKITGTSGRRNGEAQISAVTCRTKISSGTVPAPVVFDSSTPPLNTDLNTFLAANEGKLIKIISANILSAGTFSSGTSGTNYSITSCNNQGGTEIRVDPGSGTLIGSAIPTVTQDITGIVGHFITADGGTDKLQVFPRSASDLSNSGTTCTVSGGCGVTTFTDSPTQLDVFNWNIEWIGHPTNGPSQSGSGDATQIANAQAVLNGAGADVYMLQEICQYTPADPTDINTSFGKLVQGLNTTFGVNAYSGECSAAVSGSVADANPQRVCIIYKNSVVTKVFSRPMFDGFTPATYPPTGTPSQFWASGRKPFMFMAKVNINNQSDTILFVGLHAKAGSAIADYNRRKYDVRVMYDTLQAQYPTRKTIVLGDLNDDVDRSIASSTANGNVISSYSPFLYTNPDETAIGGTRPNADWNPISKTLSDVFCASTVSFPDYIDHQIISNEMTGTTSSGFKYVPSSVTSFRPTIPNYATTTSDHYATVARFQYFTLPITSVATGNWSSPTTWDCNCVPTATDNVVIDTPHTVTVDAASQAKSINLKGILNYLAPFVLSLGQ